MSLWPELRSLPRIANTLLDLVRLSQEHNHLLRELIEARTGQPARTRRAHPRTARQQPLDETSPASGPPSSSRRPPASGDRVWRQTRETLEAQLAEKQDRRLHPERYPVPQAAPSADPPSSDTPTPTTPSSPR